MTLKYTLLLFLTLLAFGSCASVPTGPTVTVLPAPGKPFDVFQADDAVCRHWAQQQIGGASPRRTGDRSTLGGAGVGALAGAGLGAAVGAATGNVGAGAAIGGATGAVGGASAGSSRGSSSAGQLQRQYDIAYQQCMYSKGNQVAS
jgi:hypothetical protein